MPITRYHAVMLDETHCEFGATVEASTRDAAYEKLREDYPESQCIQLESPEDTAERERRTYLEADLEVYGDWDDVWDY